MKDSPTILRRWLVVYICSKHREMESFLCKKLQKKIFWLPDIYMIQEFKKKIQDLKLPVNPLDGIPLSSFMLVLCLWRSKHITNILDHIWNVCVRARNLLPLYVCVCTCIYRFDRQARRHREGGWNDWSQNGEHLRVRSELASKSVRKEHILTTHIRIHTYV